MQRARSMQRNRSLQKNRSMQRNRSLQSKLSLIQRSETNENDNPISNALSTTTDIGSVREEYDSIVNAVLSYSASMIEQDVRESPTTDRGNKVPEGKPEVIAEEGSEAESEEEKSKAGTDDKTEVDYSEMKLKELVDFVQEEEASEKSSEVNAKNNTGKKSQKRSKVVPVNYSQLTPEELALLGISVHYLTNEFMVEVKNAGLDETSNIEQIEEFAVLKRKGISVVCPIDKKKGAAYVHSVEDTSVIGRADFMLSYAWNYSIGDILDTLNNYCESNGLDPEKTFVWIYFICSNRHRIAEKSRNKHVDVDETRSLCETRVKKIGHVVAIMAPWEAPTYLTQIWCLYEAYTASKNDCEVTMIMPSRERDDLLKGTTCDNGADQVNTFFKVIGNVDVKNAKAAVGSSDRENLIRFIEDGVGFDIFNAEVNGLVREWALDFVQNGIESRSYDNEDTYSKEQQGSLLNIVAEIFFQIREVDRSLRMGKTGLGLNESVHGKWHKQTAKSLFLVGISLFWKFDFDAAMTLQKEALAIRERVLGRDDGDTAESMVWIARILHDKGEKVKAMKMHQDALEIRETVFGRAHEKTAESLNSIATMLEQKGDNIKALKLYQEIVEINEIVFGRDHKETARGILNVALLVNKKGDLEKSLKLFKDAFIIFEKVLDSDHDYTIYTRDEIARLSKEVGEQYLKLLTVNLSVHVTSVTEGDNSEFEVTYNTQINKAF